MQYMGKLAHPCLGHGRRRIANSVPAPVRADSTDTGRNGPVAGLAGRAETAGQRVIGRRTWTFCKTVGPLRWPQRRSESLAATCQPRIGRAKASVTEVLGGDARAATRDQSSAGQVKVRESPIGPLVLYRPD